MVTRRSAWWVVVLELAAVGAVTAVAIARYENPTIHTDESYHLMCARSLNAGQGLPIIAQGPYKRAWVFSYAVAYSQAWLGDSLTAARLPAIVSAVALVMAVFAWIRARADRVAAWTAALLLGLSVLTLDIAQFCRFYTMHALVAFAMCAATYEVFRPQATRWWRAGWALLGLAATPLAMHLQDSTAVTMLALGTYVVLLAVWHVWTTPRLSGRGKLIWLGAIAAACAAAVALAVFSGPGSYAIARFRWAPRWTDPNATVWYYHSTMMMPRYPLLWTLAPLALLVALMRWARLAIFLSMVFLVSFMVMSLSQVHAPRYIYFAMPMFAMVWGLAISTVVRPVHRWLVLKSARRVATPGLRRVVAAGWGVAIVLVLAYAAYRTPAYYRTYLAIRSSDEVDAIAPWGDYAAAIAAIRHEHPTALDVPFLLAAPKAKAMYYFPGTEIFLLGKTDEGDASRMVVDAAQLRDAIARHERGLVVVDGSGGYWRDPRFVTPQLADAIEASTTRLPTPKSAGVHIFRWGPPSLDSPASPPDDDAQTGNE